MMKMAKPLWKIQSGMKTEVFKIKQKLFEYKYPDLTLKVVTEEEV